MQDFLLECLKKNRIGVFWCETLRGVLYANSLFIMGMFRGNNIRIAYSVSVLLFLMLLLFDIVTVESTALY